MYSGRNYGFNHHELKQTMSLPRYPKNELKHQMLVEEINYWFEHILLYVYTTYSNVLNTSSYNLRGSHLI